MVTLNIRKPYFDVELKRKVLPKEEMIVDITRARKLTSMGLAEVIKIEKLVKLSKRKNGKANGTLQKGK